MPIKQWVHVGLIYTLGVLANISLGIMAPLAVDLRTATHVSSQGVGVALGALYIPFFVAGALVGRAIAPASCGSSDRPGETRAVLTYASRA
jgi:hypothetical protein